MLLFKLNLPIVLFTYPISKPLLSMYKFQLSVVPVNQQPLPLPPMSLLDPLLMEQWQLLSSHVNTANTMLRHRDPERSTPTYPNNPPIHTNQQDQRQTSSHASGSGPSGPSRNQHRDYGSRMSESQHLVLHVDESPRMIADDHSSIGIDSGTARINTGKTPVSKV